MFLSLIIPVYNTEKYLAECLDSCLAQDLGQDDYEIICVNDGSKDGSAEILERYSSAHPNIKVINQENAGISAARNNGIDHASGTYVWFVDSDDFIRENFLRELKMNADSKMPERINFRGFEFQHEQSQDYRSLRQRSDFSGMHSSHAGIWTSIYRRDYLHQHHLRFRSITHGEDIIFIAEFSNHEHNHVLMDNVAYFYRRNPDSVTNLRTEIQKKNYLESHIEGAIILDEMCRGTGHNRTLNAVYLMHFLRCAMVEIAKRPRAEAAQYLERMTKSGLFPYKTPKEITDKRTFMTRRTDWIGKLFNWILVNSSTRLGYRLLRLWYLILNLRDSIIK